MSAIAPEVWSKLAASPPSGESLTARIAIPNITERLLAAIDSDARRHLLVLLKPYDEELHDTQSRGVTVATRELTVQDRGTAKYLDIACLDTSGHEAFDLIGRELADGVKSADANPAALAAHVLSRWRRFWGHSQWQLLSRQEQLGLFAELWFLSAWLIPRAGIIRALDGWRGPFGARHDFEWPAKSIEIKATTSTRGRIHRVNGLDQLEPPEQGELLFFSLQLREEGGATNSLPRLVASCRVQLESEPDALSLFERALVQGGYSPVHDEEYAKLKLRVVAEDLFRVTKDFPSLTPASIAGGIPPGVERVEYEINLSGCGNLIIASNPAAMPNL